MLVISTWFEDNVVKNIHLSMTAMSLNLFASVMSYFLQFYPWRFLEEKLEVKICVNKKFERKLFVFV